MKTLGLVRIHLVSVSISLMGCFDSGGGTPGGNTNWLQICESDSDCDDGFSCLCGVCTTACTDSADCSDFGTAATCGPPSSLGEACAAMQACVVTCDGHDECHDALGGAYACIANACVVDAAYVDNRRRGGDVPPCGERTRSQEIAWDEDTEFGAPMGLFERLEGTCQAPLVWNASGSDLNPPSPRAGQSDVTVEVQLDPMSARLVATEARYGDPAACRALQADAAISVRTADGTFDAMGTSILSVGGEGLGTVNTLSFEVAIEDHAGSFAVPLRSDESASLSFTSDGPGETCSGTIQLGIRSARDGVGNTSQGEIGNWTATGCPLASKPFDPLQTLGTSGQTLGERIADSFGVVNLQGTWDDGAKTELSMRLDVQDAGVLCAERGNNRVVTVPVRIAYGTTDDRLAVHQTDASVRVNLTEAGEVSELSLWLSEELVCTSESTALVYSRVDCAQMASATVQLGLNQYGTSAPEISDAGLQIYFRSRTGGDPPARHTLTLGTP